MPGVPSSVQNLTKISDRALCICAFADERLDFITLISPPSPLFANVIIRILSFPFLEFSLLLSFILTDDAGAAWCYIGILCCAIGIGSSYSVSCCCYFLRACSLSAHCRPRRCTVSPIECRCSPVTPSHHFSSFNMVHDVLCACR